MKSRWNTYLLGMRNLIVLGIFVFIIYQLIIIFSPVPEVGFSGKTLWDWMELLIIPFVLAIGAFFLNRSEKEIERKVAENRANLEREIAKDRQQEVALQNYIDRMSELLIERNLLTEKDKKIRDVARIRTLSVLRGLDSTRKGIIILFLHEAGLIFSHFRHKPEETVIFLKGADLSGIDLSGANIDDVNLSNTNLSRANFEGTIFDGCSFSYSNLTHANLQGCDLAGDNGPGLPSDIFRADLSFANLTNALVVDEKLIDVESLKGAIMPDGTKHE